MIIAPKKEIVKIIPVFLPNGSPAKNLSVTFSIYPMIPQGRTARYKTENTYKTNDKGELILSSEKRYSTFDSYVIDVKGYALHIQAYHQLTRLDLMPDEGFDGLLLDKNDKPIKNRELCVSQSIGLIWGQILIPKGINQTTTNDKGEFTMRQMILNSKEYNCSADIEFINEQSKLGLLSFNFEHTFYKPNYKKPTERIKVIKFKNEFIGEWAENSTNRTLSITPSEILLVSGKSELTAYYKIAKKSENNYQLDALVDSNKKNQFLGHQIDKKRNYLSFTLKIKDNHHIEIKACDGDGKSEAEAPIYQFKQKH